MCLMNRNNETQLPRCFGCSQCGLQLSSFGATCPRCGNMGLVEYDAPKTGRIVDFVPIFFPPQNLADLGQYVSVLVKLDNACQLFGIMLEDQENIEIGSSVVISSYDRESKKLFFKLA